MVKAIERLILAVAVRNFKDSKNISGQDLSANSIMYLEILSFYDKISISDFAKKLGVSRSAITLKMNELIEAGYVTKQQDKNDKRFHYVSLEENERQKLDSQLKIYDMMIEEVEKSKPQSDLDAFKRVVSALTNVIGEYNESN